MKDATHDVGVIVGRFQVHELHSEHRRLIEDVCEKHDKVVIFLGLAPVLVTQENPLDFEARKQMILEEFPQVNVLYVKDMSDDDLWSRSLDGQIKDLVTPAQTPILYGGRDSFISHYSGIFPVEELEPETYVRFSGTDLRRSIARSRTKDTPDFRAGVVWAAYSRFPTAYPTVDIAIFNEDETKVLLAKKPYEKGWRLIGGFADPQSEKFEQDARREVHEEAHIEITDPIYIDSFKVDDWRYRKEKDKIKTLLFRAKHMSGAPTPDDDIEQLRWFDVNLKTLKEVMPNHQPLLRAAFQSLES